MTDGDALRAAILDNPDDDTPRLVYADWLDEAGQSDYAEFIRVQIELSHCRDESCRPGPARCGRCYGCIRRERESELWPDRYEFSPICCTKDPERYRAYLGRRNPMGFVSRGLISRIKIRRFDFCGKALHILYREPIEVVHFLDKSRLEITRSPGEWHVPTTG